MFRKLSKIVICGSIAIFCTLFANPNATQTINTQNASSIIQLDNLRTQNISDSILSIQELSATNVLIDTVVSSLKSFGDVVSNGFCMTSYAANAQAFSPYWFQNSDGSWSIREGVNGPTVVSAWVCDNAMNPANVNDNWYLIDANGRMYTNIIQSGNDYFLLCPEHSGCYGAMITTSFGYSFNGQTFYFDQNHTGSYGKILNPEVIAQSGLPVTQVSNTTRVLYTANFNSYGNSGNSGGSGNSSNSGSSGYSGVSGSGYGAGNSLGGSNSGGSVQQQSSGNTGGFGFEAGYSGGFDSKYENANWEGIDSSRLNNLAEMASHAVFS